MLSGGHRDITQATHLQLFPESSLLLCQLLLIIPLLLQAWEMQFLAGKQNPSNGRAPESHQWPRTGYQGSYGGHPVG